MSLSPFQPTKDTTMAEWLENPFPDLFVDAFCISYINLIISIQRATIGRDNENTIDFKTRMRSSVPKTIYPTRSLSKRSDRTSGRIRK